MLKQYAIVAVIPVFLALAVGAKPALAADSEPDLFQSLGKFVMDGLGPARTMEDIVRDERKAAQARAAAEEEDRVRADEVAVSAVPVAPIEVAEPVAAAPLVVPAVPTPVKMAKVEPAKVESAKAEPAKVVVPVVVDVIMPPPLPRPHVAEVKAVPVVLPPPEPLKSHIAATATLDQAVKLGAPSGFFSRGFVTD